MNALYTPLNIYVALTGVIVWTQYDEIEMVTDGDRMLTNFLHYRKVSAFVWSEAHVFVMHIAHGCFCHPLVRLPPLFLFCHAQLCNSLSFSVLSHAI